MTRHRSRASFLVLFLGLAIPALAALERPASATPPPDPEMGSLKGIRPPLPDLTRILKNRRWALALGKALFFDQQLGSDGLACASCHYSAGADSRIRNQINPGSDGVFGGVDTSVSPPLQTGLLASGAPAGPNVELTPADFPLHQLADPEDRNSAIVYTTTDRVTSAGVVGSQIVTMSQNGQESCVDVDDATFHVGPKHTRRTEGRNTPTMINAIFGSRSFWDGRANSVYNGVGVFGDRETQGKASARVVVLGPGQSAKLETMALPGASLASQADGPPLSSFEMSCRGRTFADVGRKMLARQPLALQSVDDGDSVLGDLAAPGGHGLSVTYGQMIERAFANRYWADTVKRRVTAQGQLVADPTGYLQRELNFSMFFGLSLMLYEATLVSDESPVDHYFGCAPPQCAPAVPPDPYALSKDEVAGFYLFKGKGHCARCHGGPLLSNAALVKPDGHLAGPLIERMVMEDGGVALYDQGYYNTGVTPAAEDLGLGGTDSLGNPLSFTRQYLKQLRTGASPVDPLNVNPCDFDVPFDPADCSALPSCAEDLANLRVAVDGAFKTPILRNVGLTPPYLHNGSAATLDQVIDFYNRGGNRRGSDDNDSTGTGPLGDGVIVDPSVRGSNAAPNMGHLGLTATEKAQLKAFLLALTDDRVRCRKAPFDGPSLSIPNGHSPFDVLPQDGRLDDLHLQIPATGAGGLPEGECLANTGNLFDIAP